MNEIRFSFIETVGRSFVLNGKRYTVKRPPSIASGTYKLTPTKMRQDDEG